MRELSFITEPDLYRLIVASKLPSAQKVEKDGEPWWVAKDVCNILEIDNSRQATSYLDNDEKDVISNDTPSGIQSMTVISEAGLYSLILRSRKPEAKAFKRWITHDVLPTIRKTGRGLLVS